MKKLMFILTPFFFLVLVVCSQTNFTEMVTALWYTGQKTNVLNIAEQRLQVNSNDIAGLILKMEYEIAFLQLDSVSNTMERILDVGPTIKTTNFATMYTVVSNNINHLLNILPLYPPDELAADREKGNISAKPLPHAKALKALEDDGYFE